MLTGLALEAVASTIIEGALSKGAAKATDIIKEKRRLRKYDEELGATATVFNEKLETALEVLAEEKNDPQLREIVQQWDEVAPRLDDISLTYDADDDAVDRLCQEIHQTILAETPDTYTPPADLRDAIETVFQRALEEFVKEIQGTELEERLDHQYKIDITSRLNEVKEQLAYTAKYIGRYEDFTDLQPQKKEGWRNQVRQLLAAGEYYQPYIPPPDLEEVAGSDRLLIVGRAGTGKTRALLEMLDAIETNTLDRVIVPHDSFNTLADVEPLRKRDYDDDVLLLWDDIHEFTDADEDVRAAIQKLERKVADDGHRLWVWATIRRGEFDAVFEDQDRPARLTSQFWQTFETAEIDTQAYFTEHRIEELADAAIDHYGLEVNPEVRDAFVKTVLANDPRPEYIEAICQRVREEADGVLMPSYLADVPKDTRDLWTARCEQLANENPTRYDILRALWVVDQLDVPLMTGPVAYLYEEWLNGEGEFETHCKYLASRGWFTLEAVEEAINEKRVQIHDIRLEAIEVATPDFEGNERELRELSEILDDPRLEWELGAGPAPDLPAVVHASFAEFIAERFVYHDRFGKQFREMADRHFQRAVDLSEETSAIYIQYISYLNKQGRGDDAIEVLATGVDEYPSDTGLRREFASLLEKQGKVEQAREQYKTGLDHDPGDTELRRKFARFLKRRGKTDEAIEQYKTLIEHNPSYIVLSSPFLEFMTDKGRINEVIRLYQTALENSDDSEIYLEFVDFLNSIGRVDEAIDQCKTELEHNPGDAQLRREFVNFLISQDRIDEAIDQCEIGLEYNPGDAQLRREFVNLLASQDRIDEAIEQFEIGLEHNPGDTELRGDFVKLLASQDCIDEAIQQYEIVLEHDPTLLLFRPFSQDWFIDFLADQGRVDEAIELFESVLKYASHESDKWKFIGGNLSEFLISQGRIDDAIEQYKIVLKHHPDATVIRDKYSRLLADQGRIDEAIQQYEIGLEHNPGDAQLRRYFAKFLADEGRVNEAIRQYETALECTPGDMKLRRMFAEFLAEKGRIDGAIQQYETILEHMPGEPEIRYDYARFLAEQGRLNETIEQFEITAEHGFETDLNLHIRRRKPGFGGFGITECPVEDCDEKGQFKTLLEHLRTDHIQ